MTNSNQAPTQGHGLDGFYAALRRPGIVRGTDQRWFAGVSTGIARWLGVDPLVVRAGFILLSIFFGVGVGLYLVLWLLMPDDRGNLAVERALRDGDGGSIFLLVVTGIAVLGGAPWWGGDFHGPRIIGFGLLVAGAWWFLTRTDTGRDLMTNKPWRNGAPGGPSTGNAAANAGAAYGTTSSHTATPPLAPPAAGGTGATPFAPTAHQPSQPREVVRSIGFAAGLLVLGLAVVAGVVLHQVALAAGWAGNPLAIGIAAGVGVLGLGIVISGLAGRRAGGLSFFAVVGMIVSLAISSAPAGLTMPFRVGEKVHTVTTLTGADEFQLGLGEMTVDLRDAKYAQTSAKPDVVTATMGVGQLNITVPEGVAVRVNTKARLGEVNAVGATATSPSMSPNDSMPGVTGAGTNVVETMTFGPVGGPPEIVVDAEVGMGEIVVGSAP